MNQTNKKTSGLFQYLEKKRADKQAFLESIETGVYNRNHISHILETMKLLDSLYRSADIKKEIEL